MFKLKNFNFTTKYKNRLKFPSINPRSFSSMKFKELTRTHLKFAGPLNLTVRNYHPEIKSWSEYMDDLPFKYRDITMDLTSIIAIGSGLGRGTYEIVEYSKPLSEILLVSATPMVVLPIVIIIICVFWNVIWRLYLPMLFIGIVLYCAKLAQKKQAKQ